MKSQLPRLSLASIILVELLILLYLALSGKIPFGHDGFQYFILQYYFLNNSIQSGEIAQWMPYMTHGTVANWWYYLQGSPLQSLWILSGGLLSSVNFLYIYYLGIFTDLLLLICGIWVLAGFLYQSTEAKIMATITAVISCIWFDQPWFNLHFFYLIPLTLYFFLKFFDSHKISDLLIAGNISILQLFGTAPYFAPVISLAIFIFLATYLLTHKDKAKSIWDYCFKKKWAIPAFCFSLLVPLTCCLILLKNGTGEIVNYNPGRDLDGTVSLKGFLTYGRTEWDHWQEIFTGFSPALDFNIYIGILPLTDLLFFLTHKPKKIVVPVLTTAAILILFAEGTFVSKAFYYTWPGMNYYRHLALVLPIIKIFLCLLSGFAIDHLLNSQNISKKRFFFLLTLLTMGIAISLFLYKFPSIFYSWLQSSQRGLPYEPSIWNLSDISSHFFKVAIVYLTVWIIFYLFFVWSAKENLRKTLVWACLLFTFAELCYYQLHHANQRLVNLEPNQYQQLHFQPMPYLQNRSIGAIPTDRMNAFQKYLEPLANISRAAYWSTESFLFQDTFSSPYRTDHWLRPLELLMRAGHGFPSLDISVKPPYMKFGKFVVPENNKSILLSSGVSRDKLILFETAYLACTEEDASKLVRHPDYDGTELILTDPHSSNEEKACQTAQEILQEKSEDSAPEQSDSHNQKVKVLYFSANVLQLEVDNPPDNPRAHWLYYADTWHPLWRAQVNGNKATVYQANLAYKAIRLEPGSNRIEFRFGSSAYKFAALTISLNWLFLLGIAVAYPARLFFRKTKPTKSFL